MTRISSPVFVGRATELAELARAWESAVAGDGRLRLVYGEAGIGKSRLLGALAERILADGGTVARGRCLDVGEGTMPFGPIAEALRALDRGPGRATADQRDATPATATSRADADADAGQGGYFETVASDVVRAARVRPVGLFVEDAHWIDAASRDLLRYLAHALRNEPVLIVVTVRDDEPTDRVGTLRSLAELDREPHAARLDLRRFTLDEVEAQLAGILGRPPGRAFAASVHGRSGGNPFFTEEVVALDIAEGSQVPPSLRDLVLSRTSSLDEPARRLLEAAAVAGRWVLAEPLRRVARLTERQLAAALRSVVRSHLLESQARDGRDGYAFRHALVRDAVYRDLLPSDRRQLHAAWAAELEDLLPGSAAASDHWSLAGRPDRAAPGYIRAAASAAAAFAHAEAARLYGHAIEALGPARGATVAGLDRIGLLERAAQEHEFASERDEAIERLTEATRDPDFGTDRRRAIGLLRQLAEVAVNRARNELAQWAIDEALTLVGDQPDADGASVLAASAMHLSLMGELEAAREAATRAVAAARRIGAPAAEARALRALAELTAMSDIDAGVEALTEAARVAEAAGDVAYQYQTLSDIPWALANAGRYADALQSTDELYERATAAGVGGALVRTHLARRIEYLTALGRFAEAEPEIDAAEAARGWMARLRAAILRARQGRAEDGARLLHEAFELVPFVSPTVPDRGAVALARVNLAIAAGDPSVAVDLVEEAGSLPGEADMESELRLLAVRACGLAADRAHRSDARAGWVERARGHLDRLLDLEGEAGAAVAIAARALDGTAEVRRLDGVADAEAWGLAARAWSALSVPERVAHARYREAEARLTRGESRRAVEELLREALRTASRIGAAPLLAEIEGLARRGRISVATIATDREPRLAADAPPGAARGPIASTPADPHGLTARELEVLGFLVAGRTNREIGAALYISPKTAGVHVSNILGKLGAVNRVEAASIAHRLGLLEG